MGWGGGSQFFQGYPSCPRGAAVLTAGPNGEEMRALLRSGGVGRGSLGAAGPADLEAGRGGGHGGQPCRNGCAHHQRGGEPTAAASAAGDGGGSAGGGGGGEDAERLRQQLRDIGFDD